MATIAQPAAMRARQRSAARHAAHATPPAPMPMARAGWVSGAARGSTDPAPTNSRGSTDKQLQKNTRWGVVNPRWRSPRASRNKATSTSGSSRSASSRPRHTVYDASHVWVMAARLTTKARIQRRVWLWIRERGGQSDHCGAYRQPSHSTESPRQVTPSMACHQHSSAWGSGRPRWAMPSAKSVGAATAPSTNSPPPRATGDGNGPPTRRVHTRTQASTAARVTADSTLTMTGNWVVSTSSGAAAAMLNNASRTLRATASSWSRRQWQTRQAMPSREPV